MRSPVVILNPPAPYVRRRTIPIPLPGAFSDTETISDRATPIDPADLPTIPDSPSVSSALLSSGGRLTEPIASGSEVVSGSEVEGDGALDESYGGIGRGLQQYGDFVMVDPGEIPTINDDDDLYTEGERTPRSSRSPIMLPPRLTPSAVGLLDPTTDPDDRSQPRLLGSPTLLPDLGDIPDMTPLPPSAPASQVAFPSSEPTRELTPTSIPPERDLPEIPGITPPLPPKTPSPAPAGSTPPASEIGPSSSRYSQPPPKYESMMLDNVATDPYSPILKSTAPAATRAADTLSDDGVSVISGTSRNSIIYRADLLRQQATAEEQERSRLWQERREAEREGRVWDAFLLKVKLDEVEQRAKKLHEKAERRYYQGNI
jgi:hypothetical protein